jgi:hypothetical protein
VPQEITVGLLRVNKFRSGRKKTITGLNCRKVQNKFRSSPSSFK